MPSQAVVVIDSLSPSDPESAEIIRSLNVELEPFGLKAGPPDATDSWMVYFVSDATAGGEPREMIRAKLEEVHPNPWDHVRVAEPN